MTDRIRLTTDNVDYEQCRFSLRRALPYGSIPSQHSPKPVAPNFGLVMPRIAADYEAPWTQRFCACRHLDGGGLPS
ncbi:hypothetical protein JCM25156A_03590 [Komagataeibacter kakiaceti JCM 25156]